MLIRVVWGCVGLYVAVLGAVVHRHDDTVLGVSVPWGLLLALLPLVPLALLAEQTVRLGSAALLIGWGLIMALQGTVAPGSYLVASDAISWTYTIVGLGCLVAVVLRVSRLRR